MRRLERRHKEQEPYNREKMRDANFLQIARSVAGTELERAVPHVGLWQGEKVEGKLLGLRADDLQSIPEYAPWFVEIQVLHETLLFVLELAHRHGILLADRHDENIFIEAVSTLETGEQVFRDKSGKMRVVQIDFDIAYDLWSSGKNPKWQSLPNPALGLLHLSRWTGSKAARSVRYLFAQNLYKNLSLPLVKKTILTAVRSYDPTHDARLGPRKDAQEITEALHRLRIGIERFCPQNFSSLKPLISHMRGELVELQKREAEIILTPSFFKKVEEVREIIDSL